MRFVCALCFHLNESLNSNESMVSLHKTWIKSLDPFYDAFKTFLGGFSKKV